MRLLVCTLFPRVTYTFGMHIIPTSDHRLAAPLTPAIGMAGLISFHDRRHDALHVACWQGVVLKPSSQGVDRGRAVAAPAGLAVISTAGRPAGLQKSMGGDRLQSG